MELLCWRGGMTGTSTAGNRSGPETTSAKDGISWNPTAATFSQKRLTSWEVRCTIIDYQAGFSRN